MAKLSTGGTVVEKKLPPIPCGGNAEKLFPSNASFLYSYLKSLETGLAWGVEWPILKKLYSQSYEKTHFLTAKNNLKKSVSDKIDAALSLLDLMIANEHEKETAFIFSKIEPRLNEIDNPKLKQEFQTLISSLNSTEGINWPSFIKLLNATINGFEESKRILRNLKQNLLVRSKGGGKGSWSHTQANSSMAMVLRNLFTDQGKGGDKDFYNGLIDFLMQRVFKNGLPESANDFLNISSEVASLVKRYSPNNFKWPKNVTDVLKQNKALDNYLKDMDGFLSSEQTKLLNLTQTNILSPGLIESLRFKNATLGSIVKKAREENNQDKLTFLNIIDSFYKADLLQIEVKKKNSGMLGEKVVESLQSNLGLSSRVGQTGTKTDVITVSGALEVNIRQKKSPELDRSFNELMDGFHSSYSEFAKNSQNLKKNYDDLDKELTEQQKNMENLEKSFIIHNNIKDYATIGTSKTKSFSGGQAWAAADFLNVLEQTGFVTSTLGKGNANQTWAWIKYLMINGHKNAVGSDSLSPLESFLATFVTTFLFSDGTTLITDVLQKNAPKSFDVLHLYPLNELVVPSSYLMQLIRDDLAKTWADLSGVKYAGRGAKVSISYGSFDSQTTLDNLSNQQLTRYGKPRWEAYKEEVFNSIKVNITIMSSFVNLANLL